LIKKYECALFHNGQVNISSAYIILWIQHFPKINKGNPDKYATKMWKSMKANKSLSKLFFFSIFTLYKKFKKIRYLNIWNFLRKPTPKNN